MDTLFTRLEEASRAGDVNSLEELLQEDKHLLEKVNGRTSVGDNPLHIAAMLGHHVFVRKVINSKPDLAKELNGQGLSPLHLAAAHGHDTVVKELLKLKELLKDGSDLCLISEEQEGLLPLHIAVKKRRTVIVKELVEACEEAVHKLTNCGETILHLAVKYNSLDTVEFLIDRVHDLNAKDDSGNTILHHAVESRKLLVVKFLLGKDTIDVNTLNLKLSTPLDVLLESRQQHGDLILGEMIRAKGGKTAAEVQPNLSTQRTSLQQPYIPTLKKQNKNNEKKHDHKVLLLVATLVATVTFQAALNPPGGVQPDDDAHKDTKGQPVFRDSLKSYQVFVIFALFSSVSVMMLLLCGDPRKKKVVMKFLVWVIWCAAFSMGLACTMGISALYDYKGVHNPFFIYANETLVNANATDDCNNTANANATVIVTYGNSTTGHEDHWASVLLSAWLILFEVVFSWVLVLFLIFLLKKRGLWDPIRHYFGPLKKGCSRKWEQLNGSNCCQFFKLVVYILLIITVLAGIALPWVLELSTYLGKAAVL